MDRRRFLQNLAATTAAANTLGSAEAEAQPAAPPRPSRTRGPVDVEGHTVVCKFTAGSAARTRGARATWTVYEDLRVRDGAITFVGSNGESRVLPKSAEAAFEEAGVTPYLGLKIEDIGMSGRDLLAEKLLAHGDDPDLAPATLPDRSWVDLTSHCFAKELMIRPGGVSPKYGAVDRDYFGNEYDGFQDIFTSALYTNLEWGRFDTARLFLDDYFSNYVEPNGMINMRGPETGQFGLTLLLVAKYFRYTRDTALILKHRAKIEATAKVLTDLHDIALALPKDDPKHGLIQGWSESDACLHPWPHVWWQPYYANTAFAARGLKDIADAYGYLLRSTMEADAWKGRSRQLTLALVDSMRAQLRRDLDPPYVPPMPGTKVPFREAMAAERPSPLQWPHRLYAELLQPDVLPEDLANLTIDTLRTYGGTVLGIVANIGPARPGGKSLLGFISYGYAQMLLRLDRIEEYLLFLYSHRYHDHTRGSWTAGEVSGIRGGTSLFCIPAQQTIPLLVRWMLVLEDSDADRLYFGKAVPREWLAKSGPPLGIERAPTKWGRVSFNLTRAVDTVTARVTLATAGSPRELR